MTAHMAEEPLYTRKVLFGCCAAEGSVPRTTYRRAVSFLIFSCCFFAVLTTTAGSTTTTATTDESEAATTTAATSTMSAQEGTVPQQEEDGREPCPLGTYRTRVSLEGGGHECVTTKSSAAVATDHAAQKSSAKISILAPLFIMSLLLACC